jgi:hypothetical protein
MKSLMSVLEATISGAQGSSVLLRNGLVAPSEADVAGRQILDFHAIPGGPAKGHGVLRMTKRAAVLRLRRYAPKFTLSERSESKGSG